MLLLNGASKRTLRAREDHKRRVHGRSMHVQDARLSHG